jgi:hypothetical protein
MGSARIVGFDEMGGVYSKLGGEPDRVSLGLWQPARARLLVSFNWHPGAERGLRFVAGSSVQRLDLTSCESGKESPP